MNIAKILEDLVKIIFFSVFRSLEITTITRNNDEYEELTKVKRIKYLF